MANYEEIKSRQQQTWATGDFAMIGWNTVYPGELLCEAVDLRAGDKVLDVATGSGNAALSAARRNCEAVGLDYVPALIERARARAAIERLPASFDVGDCEALPYADGSFDVVLSVYGCMFAPDQQKAADELLRVCRPGGRIGLTNWTPTGFWGRAFAMVGRFLPPPRGLRPAPEWGKRARLTELLGGNISSMTVRKRSALFRYRSARHWIEVFSTYFGPIIRVLESLDESRRNAFLRELQGLLMQFNKSGDDSLVVSSDYLEVVAIKA